MKGWKEEEMEEDKRDGRGMIRRGMTCMTLNMNEHWCKVIFWRLGNSNLRGMSETPVLFFLSIFFIITEKLSANVHY